MLPFRMIDKLEDNLRLTPLPKGSEFEDCVAFICLGNLLASRVSPSYFQGVIQIEHA